MTKPIEETRRYLEAFIACLRDTGHSAENVKALLAEYAGMVIAAPTTPGHAAVLNAMCDERLQRYNSEHKPSEFGQWVKWEAVSDRFSAPLQDEPKCNKGTPAVDGLGTGSGDRGREE